MSEIVERLREADAKRAECTAWAGPHTILGEAANHIEELERELSEAKAGRDILSEEVNRLIDAAKQSAPRPEVLKPTEPTGEMLDAPRRFLAYCETPGRTLHGAREHLRLCGDSIQAWPAWASSQDGHITKSGMASIIWHMMEGALRAMNDSREGAK